jgi:hypothetical protein
MVSISLVCLIAIVLIELLFMDIFSSYVSVQHLEFFTLSATIIGSFANNYIQMGYKGGPGEALRKVVIGTQGITIPGSALMPLQRV